MRLALSVVLSILALHGWTELPAQSTFVLPTVVTGFAGIPWGSPESAVVAKLGKPYNRVERSGGAYLLYNDPLLGHETITTVLVTPNEGLIKGMYSLDFGPGDGCRNVYEDLRRAIAARYPSIKPEETQYNSSSLDFCGGVTIGKAGRTTLWKDPSNSSSQIAILLESGGDRILVHYESPSFKAFAEDLKRTDDRF
jgi:hypothetical protein